MFAPRPVAGAFVCALRGARLSSSGLRLVLQPAAQYEVGREHDGHGDQHEEQGQQNERHKVSYLLSHPLRDDADRKPIGEETWSGTPEEMIGGGWAPNQVCGVTYDRSSTLHIAHRLGLPKLYMLTLDVRLRHLAHFFTTSPSNEILGAWERTAQTLTALVRVEIG